MNKESIAVMEYKIKVLLAWKELAEETGNFYVAEKWVPGLLTNFKTIKRRISTYLKLLRDSETGGLDMLTKKEKASRLLELEKLDKAFRGLKLMKKTPDVLFVVDGEFESQAIKEAISLKIPCFTISNTNGNPFIVTDAIPANTNSVKSLDYLAVALKDGFKAPAKKAAPAAKTETAKTPVKAAPAKAETAKAPVAKAPAKKSPAKPTAKEEK